MRESTVRYQGPLNGGFQTGGFPDLDLSFLLCPFFVLFGTFPICPGTLRGFSRFVLFLFLGLLTAPTRNSPERVRDIIWTFPEKSGKPPGLASPNNRARSLTQHSSEEDSWARPNDVLSEQVSSPGEAPA